MKHGKAFGILFLLPLLIYSQKPEKPQDWSIQGYLKDMVTVSRFKVKRPIVLDSTIVDNLVHNRLNFHWFGHDHWSAKVEVRTRILTSSAPLSMRQIDVGNDFLDLSYNTQNDQVILNTILDRAYVQYSADKWDLKIGRQRINWGMNVAWNPNDIFNAYSIVDFDYEERPGSDAIRFQRYSGYAGGYELAIKLTDNIKRATAAGLIKWNKGSYDLQAFGGLMNYNLVSGLGVAGNIKQAGLKGEISYFHGLDEMAFDGILVSWSLDYSFANSLYLNGSFLYNSFGARKFPGLSFAQPTYTDVRSVSSTKWSTFLQSSYPVHPLVNVSLIVLYFPGGSVGYLAPAVTISAARNLDVDAIGQIITGLNGASFSALNIRMKYAF